MDPFDHKQGQAPLNQMRRVYYGDDHEVMRQQNPIDLKYPFPQGHLYPPSLSVRGGPMAGAGYLPPTGSSNAVASEHMDDPRYVPQDLMLQMRDMDDKRMRYYGYPLATQGATHAPGNTHAPGVAASLSSGLGAPIMGGMNSGMGMGMGMGNNNINTNNMNGVNTNNTNINNVNAGANSGAGTGTGNTNNNNNNNSNINSVHAGIAGLNSGIGGNMASGITSLNSGVGIGGMNAGLVAPNAPKKDEHGLVLPIPPLHVQQQIANNEDTTRKAETENVIQSKCLRCKKEFAQRLIMPKDADSGAEPKVYKLCHHCRDLQRQRSRRWQKKTKDKQGACRRCGSEIPPEEQKYVLCPQCRENLRIRKANRAAQGKCVHCLGPINALIIKEEGDEDGRRSSTLASYKVCQRCRENDKIRRTNLERMGNCNRCAKALSAAEQGKHKVCMSCRQKKKKLGAGGYPGGAAPMDGSVLVQPMSYMPEQAMMMPGQGMPAEYPVAYGSYQPMLQALQFQQVPVEHLPAMHGFQAARSYQRDRM